MGSNYLGENSFKFSDEKSSASLSAWLDEVRFYFVMVESLLACKKVGLSERETAGLD